MSYFLPVFNEIKGEYEAIIGFGSYEYVWKDKKKKNIIIKSVYNINEPSNEVIIENHNKYILFFIETK